MSFVRAHKIEIGIFMLALAVRLLYFGLSYSANGGILGAAANSGDGYFDIGQNIIAGIGYSIVHEPPYAPTSYRTPVMPYFIAGVYFLFGNYFMVILVHLLIGSIVPLLGMRIARYITAIRVIPIAVGVFLALEPTSILLSAVFLSETVFTFLFALSIIFLFRYWEGKALAPLLVSALLLGLSTLTRPPVEYLPAVLVALLFWETRKHLSQRVFVHIGLYVLVFVLTLSPWIYRNYQVFGVLGLSSQQGAALYTITVPSVLAIERKTNFSQEYNKAIAGPNETDFVQSAAYTKLALPILASHPRELVILGANTAFSFFTNDGMFDVLRQIKRDGGMFDVWSRIKSENGIQLGESSISLLVTAPLTMLQYLAALATTPLALVVFGRAVWFLITLAFLMGAWHALRQERENIYVLTAISIVAYILLTTLVVGFTVNFRYRLPVNAIILTFAAYEVVLLSMWFRRRLHTT
ncbi:MAG: glycosyltransferase family 39 protein [Candidatus Paceibacterota bacterium]|jgi:4-amino-4-deoxy-L-arabinose transferase-like glycosyltransferase